MYRNGEYSDDSMSSDDLPRGPKCVRMDEGEKVNSEIKTRKGLNVWSEMLQEREITEGVSGNLDIQGEVMKVDRGVESYTLPTHQLDSANLDRRPIQQYTDVLFDDTDLDSANDANGSKGFDNEDEGHSHKGGGRYSRNRGGDSRKTRDSQRRVDTSSRSRDHSDNPHPGSQRGRFHARGNRKRTWNDRRARAAFVSEEYSLDALMATKIPLGLDIDEVGKRIAKALGERDGSSIIMAVRSVGETLALKLFEEARNVEASGGMLVVDGSRRRTPGGVFLALFKANPDVPQAAKAMMSNMQKVSARGTRKCGETFDKEEAMLKPLLNATDVIRAECASEMSETKVENLETSIEDGEIADD
ncbi:Phosphorylated adapter RNA export protein [Toxocara canis]|uniref:Phosphorylated adapter RNA export protein n=1 Tax=Toxocara canis TaxID=6265 RepID=A0A0B2VI72_TOXCA|nr:Phosphorylated adapter RNA export protein [Toxocara canis]